MNAQQRKNEIFNAVWRACDTFRGVIDPSMYKDYILTMLFVKYLSDIRKYKLAEFEKKYRGEKVRIERAMARERFIVSEAVLIPVAGVPPLAAISQAPLALF